MSAVVLRKNWKTFRVNLWHLAVSLKKIFQCDHLNLSFFDGTFLTQFQKQVLTFEFLEEIVSCDHLNETSWTVLSDEIICLAVLTKKIGMFFRLDLGEFWALKLNCNLLRSIILLNPLELFFFRQLILSCFVDIIFIQFIAWAFVDESL